MQYGQPARERAARRAIARAHRRRTLRIQRVAAAAALLAAAALVAFAVARSSGEDTRSAATAASASPGRPPPAPLPRPPAQVRGDAARRMRVPILIYHVVSRAPPGTPNPQLWVPEESFRSEMHALRDAHYHALTMAQLFAGWTRGAGLPRKPVVVSFDDGYRSDYTHARPVLTALGWPGVLNLELRNIGKGGITAREVKALIAAGWEIDSHTIDHPDLTTLGAADLRRELVGSRRALRRRFGVPADFFCYPAGRYDATVVGAVRAAGYRGATTTVEGYASGASPYTLSRIRVNGGDSAAALLARLRSER